MPWKILILAGILSLAVVGAAQSQAPDTLWTHSYGGSSGDYSYDVQQTQDGGFIVAAETHSFGANSWNVYLIKTNTSGTEVWSRTYGGSNDDGGYCVRQTLDGGYIVTGYTSSFGAGNYDVYLIKTNASGDTLWTRTFGGSDYDYAFSVKQTQDGGYIIVGQTSSFSAGGSDVYLIKTNSSGIPVWTQTFGGSQDDAGCSVQQTQDGGYIIAGYTYSAGAGNSDVYLIKTDASGNEVWEQTYGGTEWDFGFSVQQTLDGGYVIAGSTSSFGAGNDDFYLIKTDASGNAVWTYTYGGAGADDGYRVCEVNGGGYIIAGYSDSFGYGEYDIYLVRTDAIGDTLWTQVFSGYGSTNGSAIQQTTDGGFIVAGSIYPTGGDNWNVYLIRMASETAAPPALEVTLTPLNPPISIPAAGGSFQFTATVQRTQAPQTSFYVWSRDRYPNGSYTGNLLGPVQINPPVGQQVTRLRVQNVPGTWPAGVHWYIGYANPTVAYPATDADSFSWTKLSTGAEGPFVWDAACTGEPFPGEAAVSSQPFAFGLMGASPNPFNPTTAIRYQLQAASPVSLTVYDTAGRLVATLVDGMQEAGQHSVTFDGSTFPSGVYLYHLTAGANTATGKMVLLK